MTEQTLASRIIGTSLTGHCSLGAQFTQVALLWVQWTQGGFWLCPLRWLYPWPSACGKIASGGLLDTACQV